jgi:tetratricopeptide (TPR) repeat protein
MIRIAAWSALLSASIGAVALVAWTRWLPQDSPVADRRAQTVLLLAEMPICTTMDAFAAGADSANLDPDFAAGKTALAKGQWASAAEALKLASLRDPRNADIQNFIGYAYRRIGLMELAFTHFEVAVALNPRHRGAHQHLGEAFLAAGEAARAEEHLAALERICLIPCTEYDQLKRAIAAHPPESDHPRMAHRKSPVPASGQSRDVR